MYRHIPATGSHVKEVIIDSPVDDYELLDFGGGRKLERFGPYVLDRPDPRAEGTQLKSDWAADWKYVGGKSGAGYWQPNQDGLAERWKCNLDGRHVNCQLSEHGRIGVRPKDIACHRWVRERLEGCYDLEDINVLNLFAGGGSTTLAALAAGATVTHVDSSDAMLKLARTNVGERGVEYEHHHIPAFVEGLQRKGIRFNFIMAFPPLTSHAPGGRSWDIEVDLTRLIKLFPQVVSNQCRGIWISADSGSWSASNVCQLLHDALPGRTVQALCLGIATRDGRVLSAGGAAYWFDENDDLYNGESLPPLSAEQIEQYLDVYLDAALSSRRTAAAPARELASFGRTEQDFVLHWVQVLSHTNAEMAYQVAASAAKGLGQMDEAGMEAWIIHAMDMFDRSGLHAGVSVFKEVEAYAQQIRERRSGLSLDKVQGILERFIQGLNGRGLKIEEGDQTYTDTEVIFLPGMVNRFPDREQNFRLYKTMAVHQWAQCWYGTWRMSLHAAAGHFADRDKAVRLFHLLETIRLDACIERDLPGVHRDMQGLRKALDTPALPGTWREAEQQLRRKTATVQDSYDWLLRLYDDQVPVSAPYQGQLQPKQVEQVRAARLAQDKQTFRVGLARILEEESDNDGSSEQEAEQVDTADGKEKFVLHEIPDAEYPDGRYFELTLDGKPIAPPDNVQSTMESILQDLGDIPDDYLVAAGEGAYQAVEKGSNRDAADVWQGTYHEEGAFLYNEWDYERQHYRKDWAVLRELTVHPKYDDFVAQTMEKYGGLVTSLRRVFEALRGDDRVLKKQSYGDDIDIDALVEAYGDTASGMEMSERVFTKKHKLERDIAVMFMVDMSGSTKGWINDAEREALVLLAESLETLGDRYAIYGFSGMTRKRCEVYKVKGFDEAYNDEVRARISGITPQDYTRMGVTIRHLSALLNQVEARTRLLITLSDGKPDDYDTYRGSYGIEDTRKALIEAKRDGIHSFCITIDREANDYLPHMYGAVNYTVIDEVRKLPLKVSDIYRRLTT